MRKARQLDHHGWKHASEIPPFVHPRAMIERTYNGIKACIKHINRRRTCRCGGIDVFVYFLADLP